MSEAEKDVYQFPDNHDQHLQSFMYWLFGGLATLILVATLFIWNADKILLQVPFSAEQSFVEPYEEFLGSFHSLTPEQEQTERNLQQLADNLASAMGMPEGMSIKVHYLDIEEINAFATLGGNIFVLRGLVESMPDENSLAMVLAHEIAHIKNRDPIVSISRGLAIQVVYSFFTGDPGTVFNAGTELGMLFFSREQETAADLDAVTCLHNHYGHISGATRFFEILQDDVDTKELTDDLPEWLSSHPDISHRIETIESFIQQRYWRKGEVKTLAL